MVLLSQNIKDSFEAKKDGVMFVHLTAAYDTLSGIAASSPSC